jgi:protein-tyrosine phosphatase
MKDVYWIRYVDSSKLAIVARPRGGDWLEHDVVSLRREGIDVLVSLLTAPEVEELGLDDEQKISSSLNIEFISYPIPDRTTPTNLKSFRQMVSRLVNAICAGKTVGVHCRGCIGRATVTAAATLIELGWTAKGALALIQDSRECPVPDTTEQELWICEYRPEGSAR